MTIRTLLLHPLGPVLILCFGALLLRFSGRVATERVTAQSRAAAHLGSPRASLLREGGSGWALRS